MQNNWDIIFILIQSGLSCVGVRSCLLQSPPPCFMGGRAGTDVTHMLPCDGWHCQCLLLWVVHFEPVTLGNLFFTSSPSSSSSSPQPSATSTLCWSLHQQVTASALKVCLCLCLGTAQQTPLSWAGQSCPDPDDSSTRGADGPCRLHRDSADDAPAATRLTLSAAPPTTHSHLPATAHLPLATMQAQDCSLLPTEATYLPRLTCPCGTQARDSHQPTDAICQHSSAFNTSICQPSPPDSLWSICLPSPHLPLTAHIY